MRGALAWLGALVALCASSGALAQSRPVSSVAPAGCVLQRASALSFAAPSPAPNGSAQLSIAATATGAIVAFRARTTDELVVLRVDDNLARAGEDRVVAGPVHAFALVASPGGAALVAAERVAHDGRDAHDAIVLARLDAAGNARNIPRSLARATRCDAVAVRPSATGFVVAWGSLDGPSTSTVTTDGRGVPNARPRVVVDASAPMMVSLTGDTRFAMAVRSASGASLLHLDESGASVEAIPLNGAPAALVALPSSVLTVTTSGDAQALTRWWPTTPSSELSLNLQRIVGAQPQIVSASNDRAALLVVDDRNSREHLVRVAIDGSATALASWTGARGAVTPALDGSSLFSVTHTPLGALEVARWSCPRPPSTQPTASTSNAQPGAVTDASIEQDAAAP